jgi:hypothetical protein
MRRFISTVALFLCLSPALAKARVDVYVGPTEAPPRAPAEVIHPRHGHVWVGGHYAWHHGRYVWTQGHYVHERPGWTWRDGTWEHGPRYYEWHPGRWEPVR